MKYVGLFEAKTKLSELCAHVAEHGESVVVTRRGQPWVKIEPLGAPAATIMERRALYMAEHEPHGPGGEKEFQVPARAKDLPREVDLD